MCLVLFSWQQHPRYPLIVAANRDEFYDRPTAPAGFWPEAPDLLAGRDLSGGGTWMGLTRHGRFAAVTNFRDPSDRLPQRPSRGALVRDFLLSRRAPAEWLDRLRPSAPLYPGFNLLAGDGRTLGYLGSREGAVRLLAPGLYGLSNHLLETSWPKVRKGKERLQRLLRGNEVRPDEVFDLLADRAPAPDAELPETGVGREWERRLSAIFIATPGYGTRSSTVLLRRSDGQVEFHERTYDGNPEEFRDVSFGFLLPE